MCACVSGIRTWMLQHRLKINDSKTEIIVLGSKQQLCKLGIEEFTVGSASIKVVDKVRNLGVIFDRGLSMKDHISTVCNKGFHQLYRLRQIRKYVNNETLCTLVHAFITSHLDYGNSMFYNLPDKQIHRLQRMQNAAARLIMRKRKYDSAKECLKALNWLPVKLRIEFKIALFVFKLKLGILPSYLCELLQWKVGVRTLRSSEKCLLYVPPFKTSFGKRAFTYAAPCVWNSLPMEIKLSKSIENFKKLLKSHMFRRAF